MKQMKKISCLSGALAIFALAFFINSSTLMAADTDGDGFEAASVAGAIEDGKDCDDTSAAIHPGAKEICLNGVDDDCDGQTDEAARGACVVDEDGDGYGSGYDCNDKDKTIYPGAEDVCDDGIDSNCDKEQDWENTSCSDQMLAFETLKARLGEKTVAKICVPNGRMGKEVQAVVDSIELCLSKVSWPGRDGVKEMTFSDEWDQKKGCIPNQAAREANPPVSFIEGVGWVANGTPLHRAVTRGNATSAGVSALKKQVGQIAQTVESQGNSLAATNAAVTDLTSRTETLETGLAATDAAVDSLIGRVSKTENGLIKTNAAVTDLTGRTETLETGLSATNATMGRLATATTEAIQNLRVNQSFFDAYLVFGSRLQSEHNVVGINPQSGEQVTWLGRRPSRQFFGAAVNVGKRHGKAEVSYFGSMALTWTNVEALVPLDPTDSQTEFEVQDFNVMGLDTMNAFRLGYGGEKFSTGGQLSGLVSFTGNPRDELTADIAGMVGAYLTIRPMGERGLSIDLQANVGGEYAGSQLAGAATDVAGDVRVGVGGRF